MANSQRILVTGVTGQIGSELILELRKRYGRNSILATGHSKPPTEALQESGPFEYLDTTDRAAISRTVDKYGIDCIYHLAGILSAVGEKNPQLAWQVNIDSLRNILEVSREKHVKQIFWPSSIAVFGPETPRVNVPQETVLIPRTVYGITKVAGELLCNYYYERYGLDIRSLRYPGIISSETPPGGGTTDYAVEIFYEAIKKKRYTCFVRRDTILPMLYMPDCITGTIQLMETEPSRLKVRTSYNLSGLSFSAEDLAKEIQKIIPGFVCSYEPDFRQKIADSWPQSVDDSKAREDWDWEAKFDLGSMSRDMVEKLSPRFKSEVANNT
ncbi:MAG TPA: NAD-dependent epimerase/dehydratase family protein [Nitrososphaerales archaeon]|nr:NAD-dependent epimerase/dehydratase family protein [Nitrososphaerales archaeon]